MSLRQNATKQRKGDQQFKNTRVILSKYLFYWPLFLLFFVIAFAGAYAYIKLVNPIYEVSASILVKDEKKSPTDNLIFKQEMQENEQPYDEKQKGNF